MKRAIWAGLAGVVVVVGLSPSVIGQEQRPNARVSALGELSLPGGERGHFAVWIARPGDGGGSTISVAERDGYFSGSVREARVEGGAVSLAGEGVLQRGGSGGTTTFSARLTRGTPNSFSITYQDDGRGDPRTVDGPLSAGEVDIR